MRPRPRWPAAPAAGILAALACTLPAAQGKTLVYCSEGSPENFTPAINTTGTSFDTQRPIFDKLTMFERGSTRVVPGLAESWDISADGRSYTFHLRRGVRFHAVKGFQPSREFGADDVLWSFERQWKPDHPYAKVSGGKYDYFNDMGLAKNLKALTKVDDHTVRFEFNEPDAAMLANLAMDFAAIESAEYAGFLAAQNRKEQFDQVPVGTGPFQFVTYQKDTVIRYKANTAYWGEKARVDDLVFAITPDPTARLARLKAGECHLMIAPRPADLAEIRNDPALKTSNLPGLNIGYLSLNVTKPPFDRKEVRQAMNMAVDKASILRDVFQGAGQPAKNFIPPTLWSYDDQVPPWPYDPARAKALLEKAGVKTPVDIDLWYMPVQRPYNPDAKRMAEMMQADLAKVGINARLVTYEWGEYRKRLQQGDHMAGLFGWTGDNGDPDNFFFQRSCAAARPGGQNITRWCDPAFDERLARAKATTDPKERTRLYQEMQVIQHEAAPEVLIAHSTVYDAMRKEVTGWKQSPFGHHIFAGVDLQP